MHSLCPNCESKLGEFSVECSQCGWSLLEQNDAKQIALDQQPSESELHLIQAKDSISYERFEEAVVPINRALKVAEVDGLAECYRLRGYCYLKLGQYDKAQEDCSTSLNYDWGDVQTLAWRAAAYGEQNHWREAFADLAIACELAGENRDPFINLMDSYKQSAAKYFTTQIQAGRQTADLFNERGWVYLHAQDFKKSTRDFGNALKLDPEHAWASLGQATVLFENKKEFSHNSIDPIVSQIEIALKGSRECQLAALHLRAKTNKALARVAKISKDFEALKILVGDDAQELLRLGELKKDLEYPIAALADFTRAMTLEPDLPLAVRKRADCYLLIRNYSLAIEDYDKFIRTHPRDAMAWVQRGNAFLKSGRTREAIRDFDRAQHLDAQLFDAKLGMAESLQRIKRLDEALTACQNAINLNNSRSDGFSRLGAIYHDLCHYGLAIEEYGRAIQRAESEDLQAGYLYHRGIAYHELKQFELALEDFNLSAMLRPTHAGAWIWKASACARLEKWSEAIIGLKQAIAVNPSVAREYRRMGRPVAQHAIEFFNQQQQRGQATVGTFRSRGLAYQFLQNHEKAIVDFTSALNKDSDHKETLIRRGQSFAQIGDHESAMDDFKSVIRTNKTSHRARYWRALSRFETGEPQKALVDIVKAIRSAPKVPAYHVLHGELLHKIGKKDKAINAFGRAVRLDATDAATYRRRASVHMAKQEYLSAIRDLSRSLELFPSSPDSLLIRGNAFLKTGKHAEAKLDFEAALAFNERLAKAYSGRAAAIVPENRNEYLTIWLTKALHRFESPRDLSEILFSRGKAFYRMRRFEPAIRDFGCVIELMRGDPNTVAAARIARGIAFAQMDKMDTAQKDFELVEKIAPGHPAARTALGWLKDQEQPLPEMFAAPAEVTRPTRPPVVGAEIDVPGSRKRWNTDTPYNTWVLRTANRKEYGPVLKETLDEWVEQGRIVAGMKLLRADWGKWKRAEKIYEILETKEIEIFPALKLDAEPAEGSSS